jgi:drug/metabolite transporter (DMT)-like permease
LTEVPVSQPLDGSASRPIWPEIGLLGMVLLWGVNFAVAKWAFAVIDPLAFNGLRHVLAAAFMAVVLMIRGGIDLPARSDLGRVVALGIVGNVVYQVAFIFGLDHTRAGNAGLMRALVPIFLLLVGRRGDGAHGLAWIGAILSVFGVALVSGSSLTIEGADTLVGDVVLIGAAAVWAIYTVGAQPLIDRYGPIQTTAWTLWVGSIGLFFIGLPGLLAQDWGDVGAAAWAGILYSSILSIGVAYLLWYWGVQRLGGAHTAIFSNLTPIVALAAGAIWLGEEITRYSLIGAALVIGGVLLVRTGGRR